MITERAKAGFDRLLVSSLRSGLPSGTTSASIEPLASLDGIKSRKVVVLTVSSYLFRAMVLLHFSPDAATRTYFNRASDAPPSAMDDAEFLDRVAESGNVCCGALNRDLGPFFPHVGMSTPNIIDRDCMRHVELLGCGLIHHYRVVTDGGPELHASLCVTDYGHIDFHVDPAAEAAVDLGELELF